MAALLGDFIVNLFAYGCIAFVVGGFIAAIAYLLWVGIRGKKIDYDDTP